MAKGHKSHCQQKAAHRVAQAKYVAKDPKKQAARVAKSEQKQQKQQDSGTGKDGKSKGVGKHGSKLGRPRKAC